MYCHCCKKRGYSKLRKIFTVTISNKKILSFLCKKECTHWLEKHLRPYGGMDLTTVVTDGTMLFQIIIIIIIIITTIINQALTPRLPRE
jgi:hypothetical protein